MRCKYGMKGVIITTKILLLVGQSASGKSTLGKFLEGLGIPQLISHSTREPRINEINGETYYFVTREEFANIDKLERTYYAGNYYCLSRKEVERHKEDLVYCIVDYNGVMQIKANYDNVCVIYLDVSYFQMIIRMFKRKDKLKNIYSRIKHAITTHERENGRKLADYIIPNTNLTNAKKELESIINKLKKEMSDEKETIL